MVCNHQQSQDKSARPDVPNRNKYLMILSLLAMGIIVEVSIKKSRIQTGATAISVLLLLLFPISYFTAGGFYSGVPEWFIFCYVYVCITLRGRRLWVFLLLCMAEIVLLPRACCQKLNAVIFL